MHHVAGERLGSDDLAFDVPIDLAHAVELSPELLERAVRPDRPRAPHHNVAVGDGLGDAGPPVTRGEITDDRRRTRELVHVRLSQALDSVVCVTPASFVPKELEASLRLCVQGVRPFGRTRVADCPSENAEVDQAARPQPGEDGVGTAGGDRRPVDQRPLGHLGEQTGLVEERHEPRQHPLGHREELADEGEVAGPLVPGEEAVQPVQRPVGDRQTVGCLHVAGYRHRQDPVRTRRRGELQIVGGQAPVLVAHQVRQLMDHSVAHPGSLFARRTIDEGVVAAQLHRAPAGGVDGVQPLVAAAEGRPPSIGDSCSCTAMSRTSMSMSVTPGGRVVSTLRKRRP